MPDNKHEAFKFFDKIYSEVPGKTYDDLEILTNSMDETVRFGKLNTIKETVDDIDYAVLYAVDTSDYNKTFKMPTRAGVFAIKDGVLEPLGTKDFEKPLRSRSEYISKIVDTKKTRKELKPVDQSEEDLKDKKIETRGNVEYYIVSTKSKDTGVSMLDYRNIVIKVVNDATKEDVLKAFNEPMVDVSYLGNNMYDITRYFD